MLPRALVADGSGNTSITVSTNCQLLERWVALIGTTEDAAHAHKLSPSFSFFHLEEAPFCAAVGQRTRGRLPKPCDRTLRNVNVKLVYM